MGDSQKSREPLWPMLMMVAEVRATRAPPGPAMHDRSGLRPNGGACRLGGLSRLLAAFLHLAAHLLDLTLQELLLKLDDFLRILGAHELLREVEGGVDVLFGKADRLAIDLARTGLGRLHGRLHGAVKTARFPDVLVDGLLGLGQGAFRCLPDALRRIGFPAACCSAA